MKPATRRDGDPDAPTRALRLVLELTMANGELASGTVMAEGGSAPTSFHGWIGLMDAISQLSAQADRARA